MGIDEDRLLPIACSLDASALRNRLAEIGATGAANLLAHEADGLTHRLRFRRDPETQERLERIVAAEAACCPFLELDLAQGDGALTLSISGPPEARGTIEAMAAAFGDGAEG
jgi:hypothetical protein